MRAHNATACHGDKEGRDETMDARPPRGAVQRDPPRRGATAAHHPVTPQRGDIPQIVASDNEGLLGDHIHIFGNTPDLGKWGNSIPRW